MEDFTSAAVSARRAQLRKIAGRRRYRRAHRVAEHRAPKVAKSVGQVAGSIVVTIPKFRWKQARLPQVARKVIAVADAVTAIYDSGLPRGNGRE